MTLWFATRRKMCAFWNGIAPCLAYISQFSEQKWYSKTSADTRLVVQLFRAHHCPNSNEIYFPLGKILEFYSVHNWLRWCDNWWYKSSSVMTPYRMLVSLTTTYIDIEFTPKYPIYSTILFKLLYSLWYDYITSSHILLNYIKLKGKYVNFRNYFGKILIMWF